MNRKAFTLTEILVVIAILAVLAALTTAGVLRALDTAKQTRIKVEIDNLDTALKAYRERYGSYPPSDLTDTVAVRAHVARAFPRYDLADLTADLGAVGLDLTVVRPDQSLVFWLRGFSPDPTHPFINSKNEQIVAGVPPVPRVPPVPITVAPLFDFDKSRLIPLMFNGSVYPSYIPAGLKAEVPYVYVDAAHYGTPSAPFAWDTSLLPKLSVAGFPAVYVEEDRDGDGVPDGFQAAEGFQLIASGLDGKYGAAAASLRFYPIGTGYTVEDKDNVVNFSTKARLGDAIP